MRGPGHGPAAARNLGARAAECDVVCFIDDDCVAAMAGPRHSPGRSPPRRRRRGGRADRRRRRGAGRVAASQAIVEYLTLTSLDGGGEPVGFAPSCNLAVDTGGAAPPAVRRVLPVRRRRGPRLVRARRRARRSRSCGARAAVTHRQSLDGARGFLRQQYGYGRGAARFRRGEADRRLAGAGFYRGWFARIRSGPAVGALVVAAQVAVAAGVVVERSTALGREVARRAGGAEPDDTSSHTGGSDRHSWDLERQSFLVSTGRNSPPTQPPPPALAMVLRADARGPRRRPRTPSPPRPPVARGVTAGAAQTLPARPRPRHPPACGSPSGPSRCRGGHLAEARRAHRRQACRRTLRPAHREVGQALGLCARVTARPRARSRRPRRPRRGHRTSPGRRRSRRSGRRHCRRDDPVALSALEVESDVALVVGRMAEGARARPIDPSQLEAGRKIERDAVGDRCRDAGAKPPGHGRAQAPDRPGAPTRAAHRRAPPRASRAAGRRGWCWRPCRRPR